MFRPENSYGWLCLLFLTGCAALRTGTGAHGPAPADPAPTPRMLKECLAIASHLRQLPLRSPITPATETQSGLEARMVREVDRDLPPDRLEAWRLELIAFGFMPPDFDLRPFLHAFYGEQVAGYYDPKSKRMVLVQKPPALDLLEAGGPSTPATPDGSAAGGAGGSAPGEASPGAAPGAEPGASEPGASGPGPAAPGPYAAALDALRARGITQEKILLVHELVHTLQDQNLTDLAALLEPGAGEAGSSDAIQARRALIEGDASFVMTQYMAGEEIDLSIVPNLAERSLGAVESGIFPGTKVLASGPRVFRDRLLFSYYYGMDFVAHLLREGGWPVVNRAFAHPPWTTEQIFHPARYLRGEPAHRVGWGPVAELEAAGYRPSHTGTQGELGVRIWLAAALSRLEAAQAATGWGGDRYRLYLREGHRPLAVWATSWDSEAEALEFEGALTRMAALWKARPPLFAWRREADRVVVLLGDEGHLEAVIGPAAAGVTVERLEPSRPPVLPEDVPAAAP